MTLVEKVENFIRRHKLFNRRDRILVSFSGGPDSTFLALALKELGYKITLFYINHNLREDSEKEEEHVVSFAEKWGIPLLRRSERVMDFIKSSGLSIEEGARAIRRRLLLDEMKRGLNYIATGHTLDDNIENFFIRTLRGSGFGLRVMKPSEAPFVRPLLSIRRKEILNYLDEKNIEYYIDPSNMKLEFLRNRIRHLLIPLIEEVSPQGLSGIIKSFENMQETFDALLSITKIDKVHIYPLHIEFSPENFIKAPDTIKFLALRNLLEIWEGELELKRNHIKSLPGKVELKNFVISANKKWGVITRKVKLLPVKLEKNKSTIFGDFEFSTSEKKLKKDIDFSEEIEYFDIKDIHPPILIRTRKRGDRVIPFGRKGEKKLKDLFIEAGIPDVLRGIWPVIQDRYGILMVPLVVRSDRGKVKRDSKKVLTIKFRRLLINGR